MDFKSEKAFSGYSTTDLEEDNASHQMRASSSHNKMCDTEDSSADHNDELYEYEQYGTTPPRTRILRRNRERKQREPKDVSRNAQNNKTAKRFLNRRNTVCSNTFNELIARADNTDSEQGGKRANNKRSMKLLRGSERDLKLDISRAQVNASLSMQNETLPQHTAFQPFVQQVQGCKRFMSLMSRRVAHCSKNAQEDDESCKNETELAEKIECPQNRIDFHVFLSKLVKMGAGERSIQDKNARRNISREDILWQTKLNDLIWLELQAWHADRTREEEDNYLCNSRKSVVDLINDIMTYRFSRHKQHLSASDSGIEDDCSGCLSMTCQSCMEAQSEGLSDIEKLLNRLESAESLFSSSRAFALLYPTYNSPEFVGRVKAMCLWYNLTKLQLLKIVILSRMLTLENKLYTWQLDYSSISSITESIESGSPSDSNSSTSSNNSFISIKCPIILTSISALLNSESESKPSPYRKYIENMLKTKGLMKSLAFLEKLHQHLLRKTKITLQQPTSVNIFNTIPNDSEEEELERYGIWSPESKALALPSYKAAFLFLSCIPLEVIREFLYMRLEQKPENPSPLSVRQLMRELKEGIRVATKYRQRVLGYIEAVFNDVEIGIAMKQRMKNFEDSLLQVFELYLEYVEQWSLLEHDTFQKCLLEEEWNFSCEIVQFVVGGPEVVGKKFCRILKLMLESIGERLLGRIEECAGALQVKQDDINRKQCLFTVCRELQQLFNEERDRCIKTVSFTKNLFKTTHIPAEQLHELKKSVITFNCTIPNAIEKVQAVCDITIFEDLENLDDQDRLSLTSRSREILQQGYRFGFEYYKVMSELIPISKRERLFRSMIVFANLWMKFVKERCERGRGVRPRWASHGLDFLLTVCEPQHTAFLTESEFEELKRSMDDCISHVIGNYSPLTPDSGYYSPSQRSMPRSRGSSPSPRASYRSQRSISRKTSTEQPPIFEQFDGTANSCSKKMVPIQDVIIKLHPALPVDRVRDAVEQLDTLLDESLKEQELIGHVIKYTKEPISKAHLKRRFVKFTWQRGIKIGQGRFGKVFTAVNNNTGEMMAVKEIALQHNDKYTRSKVAEELKILEGVSHQNLVKQYGLEVHKEEMLIFMEFCSEGTLDSLVSETENGLPELLTRRYTYQLLSGVAELHSHGIVHRDIKSANIFLTDEGNCLKIGDFGCATKIQASATLPGELLGFVGTQAYMAPEVFMKTNAGGHGRAADIWSVGCVVVEMASGKSPWADYDSNYQIMFKVGMGQKPEAPESLIEEGHDFLDHCLQHDPRDRATAAELLDHNFVKVGEDLSYFYS